MNSPHKGQWRGSLIFSLICVWINGWINNREAGDLRRCRAHCDVTVMVLCCCSYVLFSNGPYVSWTIIVQGLYIGNRTVLGISSSSCLVFFISLQRLISITVRSLYVIIMLDLNRWTISFPWNIRYLQECLKKVAEMSLLSNKQFGFSIHMILYRTDEASSEILNTDEIILSKMDLPMLNRWLYFGNKRIQHIPSNMNIVFVCIVLMWLYHQFSMDSLTIFNGFITGMGHFW